MSVTIVTVVIIHDKRENLHFKSNEQYINRGNLHSCFASNTWEASTSAKDLSESIFLPFEDRFRMV